jgi:NAD(P)-dependent dehydrogenase (short-subunit alcohol dehydrogenase family)
VAQTSIEEWNRVIHTNLFGSFHLSRATLAQMRQLDRGDIVMISSACTRWHYAYGSPYNVAKAGLEELAFTLAYEERKHGIRVNIVAPGLVATEMGDRLARAVNNVDTTADLDDVSPFGHVCRPEEIANVVGFLVSGTGAYVSGQRIYVDGAASPRAT